MTFRILIPVLLCFFLSSVQAQQSVFEYGFSLKPTLTVNQAQRRSPSFSYSVGPFLMYHLSPSFGLGAGVVFNQLTLNTWSQVNSDPIGNHFFQDVPDQENFQAVQFPLWFSFCLSPKPEAPVKAYFVGGYTFGKLLDRAEKETEYRLWGLEGNLHSGMVGLEFRKALMRKVCLSLGSHLNLTNIYDQAYGSITNLQFILRLSRM